MKTTREKMRINRQAKLFTEYKSNSSPAGKVPSKKRGAGMHAVRYAAVTKHRKRRKKKKKKAKKKRESSKGEQDLFTDENVVQIRRHFTPAGFAFSVMMGTDGAAAVILHEFRSVRHIARCEIHFDASRCGRQCGNRCSLRALARSSASKSTGFVQL